MKAILIIAFYFFLSACASPSETEATISFYYWKTIFKLDENEKNVLAQNHVTRLYVRYFDVALIKDEPVPLSSIVFNESTTFPVVPVVYIKNEVMLHPSVKVEELAKKVITYIDQINTKNSIQSTEIQLDCDWTLTSRETYFKFIQHLKKLSMKNVSATIRLHQVKYHRNTGIPPVDRGILMYYNMGRIAADSLNSIYDRETAKRYLRSLKNYPLKLDIALPVFSWGIHIRNNKVIGLLNKIDESTFIGDTHFEKNASYLEVKQDVLKMGHYFLMGDKIKIESVSEANVKEMAKDLSEALAQKPHEIIFYDLDNINLIHYAHDEYFFQNISSTF